MKQRGFTLLELLLVVFILSASAMMASTFVDNQDDQLRFEQTRQRLERIREAIVGDMSAVYQGSKLLSGFVVENGALPNDLSWLVNTAPAGYVVQAARSPIFDPDPDINQLNDGLNTADIPLNGAAELLQKGWRAGYLQVGAGNGFKDGWGYHWQVSTAVPNTLQVMSYAKDNAVGGAGFAADLTETVLPADNSIALTNWSVKLQVGRDIAGGSSDYLHASLLVFINDNTGGHWRRFSSLPIALSSGFDGTGDGLCDHDNSGLTPEQFCPSAFSLTFPSSTHRVPLGQHLLLLVRDNDSTPHNGGIGERPYLDNNSNRISLGVKCYAAGCTLETLLLK